MLVHISLHRVDFQGLLFPPQTVLKLVTVLLRAEPSRLVGSVLSRERRLISVLGCADPTVCVAVYVAGPHRARLTPASQQALSPSHGLR